ncbi:MAG: AI-2E family transporter, partial [Syntrophobacteraceae bacterium]
MQLVRDWFKQRFNDPQVLILIVFLVAATVAVIVLGKMLAPLFAAAIIAYLLESVVSMLEQRKMPRLAAVIVVYLLFLIFFVIVLVALVPLLFEQLTQFFQRLPQFIAWLQRELLLLPERYPDFVSEKQIRGLMDALLAELTSLGQRILSLSAASIRTIFIIVLYLFLVPILVFFSMKDKSRI